MRAHIRSDRDRCPRRNRRAAFVFGLLLLGAGFAVVVAPGAKLVRTGRRPTGEYFLTQLTVEEYITRSDRQLAEIGFRELEVARRTEQYGNIAHAFSTYDSLRGSETAPFARGINSIQLWNYGTRWWVLSIFREGERPDNPIPERYLRGEG